MPNAKNENTTPKAKNSKSALTVVGAVICAVVCFLLSYKIVMAIAAALGWFSLYEVTHFSLLQVLQAGIFGAAWRFWAFKKPTPLKAVLWQNIVYLAELTPLCIVAFALNGGPRLDFVVYMFLIGIGTGTLSGFITGWTMPHVLAWLQKSSQRPEPPSFSHPSHDASYTIES